MFQKGKDKFVDPNVFKKRGKMAKRKGAEGERMFAKQLSRRGFEARRGRQFSGSDDSPDVVCKELEYLHFEVKRVEKLNIYNAMKQSKNDCGIHKVPCVGHRKNSEEWLMTMTLFDFLNLIQCLTGTEDELNSLWSKLNERSLIGPKGRNRNLAGSGESPVNSSEKVTPDSDLL